MSVMTSKLRKTVKVMGLVSVLAIASGCTQLDRFHGFIPPEEELATLNVGSTTKAEVIALFGPPRSERGLQNNTVYYASSQFRRFGPFAPEEIDRQVLAIDFDGNDRIRNISRYTLEDGRVVVLDRRVTEDGINDITFLAQLLGSFGRINAEQLLGAAPSDDT
ncbi:outer membrane protein assembly factor BamE [Roseobacter sp. CCS2]|uniref:outer membrane protein assembly factor BamE n=1 Tax=Roseobacter sp. CCS2 TaxID=391593 RepID=UPI0000F3E59B|nr:outer membrane protein assembly factor BamE [Roseobacter sp. CCS2]EBA11100.1 lipoprotein, SmpA/OmlA family [Roseobacter sp. CCS2]